MLKEVLQCMMLREIWCDLASRFVMEISSMFIWQLDVDVIRYRCNFIFCGINLCRVVRHVLISLSITLYKIRKGIVHNLTWYYK